MTTEDGPRSSEGTTPPAAPSGTSGSSGSSSTADTSGSTDSPPADISESGSAHVPSARERSTTAERTPAHAPHKKKSFLRELPGIVITALVISVLIKTFLVQAFYIPSGSMENTLLVNDRVLVNKLADKPDEIHRGDIVVFKDPGGWLGAAEEPQSSGLTGAIRKGLVFVGLAPAAGEEDLIKRVIGVGGDTVQCCTNGHLVVNGVELDEPYLFPGTDRASAEDFGPVSVPKGDLWVMGDHRNVSEDSRAHEEQQKGGGFVPVDDVIGRAFSIVWPLDRATVLHRPATFDQPGLSEPAR